MKSTTTLLCALALVCFAAGCGDGAGTASPTPPASQKPAPTPAPSPAPEPASQPAKELGAGHAHKMTPLGEAAAGPFRVVAERGVKPPKAGYDAPVDVVLKADAGAPAVVAIRGWIGTADGKGALKLKFSVEDPAHPEHYHGHVDVPDPFEASHRLHVEIEVAGAKHVASFDLKL